MIDSLRTRHKIYFKLFRYFKWNFYSLINVYFIIIIMIMININIILILI